MCGIAGAHRSAWDVDAALARIRHRGPDGSGTAQEGATVHGHVRLALLDLTDASTQPFRYLYNATIRRAFGGTVEA